MKAKSGVTGTHAKSFSELHEGKTHLVHVSDLFVCTLQCFSSVPHVSENFRVRVGVLQSFPLELYRR